MPKEKEELTFLFFLNKRREQNHVPKKATKRPNIPKTRAENGKKKTVRNETYPILGVVCGREREREAVTSRAEREKSMRRLTRLTVSIDINGGNVLFDR